MPLKLALYMPVTAFYCEESTHLKVEGVNNPA